MIDKIRNKITMHIKLYMSISLLIVISFLSIGYSAFNTNLYVSDVALNVRLENEMRVTGVERANVTNSGQSRYEDYNINNIQLGVTLPNSSSTVKYKVIVTNFGNTEMAISNIIGLPDNLEYEITEYNLKDKICNSSNKCTLGAIKEFYITIKYKTSGYSAEINDYNLILDFDFEPIYTATYKDKKGTIHKEQVVKNDTFILDFSTNTTNILSIKMGGVEITNYTYEDGVLKIPNVTGNISIDTEYILFLAKSSSETTFLNTDIERTKIESITIISNMDTPVGVLNIYYVNEDISLTNIILYTKDDDNDGLYEVYIGSNGIIYANPNSSRLFSKMTNLTSIDFGTNFDTSYVTDMSYMFQKNSSMTYLDLSNFDTSKVTDMHYMFFRCSSMTYIDLNNFDTSQVTDMSAMFSYCNSLTSLYLNKIDVSQVTNMLEMFAECRSLTTLDLSGWKIKNSTDVETMFYYCTKLESLDIRSADFDLNKSIPTFMFYGYSINGTIYVKNSQTKAFIEAALTKNNTTNVNVIIVDT